MKYIVGRENKDGSLRWYYKPPHGCVRLPDDPTEHESFVAALPTDFFKKKRRHRLSSAAMIDYAAIYRRLSLKAKYGRLECLLRPEFNEMVKRAGGRCELTGIPFSREIVSSVRSRETPWFPSVDRIDSAQGYTAVNTRLVCLAVNIALNVWGATIFDRIAHGYFATQYARAYERAFDNREKSNRINGR